MCRGRDMYACLFQPTWKNLTSRQPLNANLMFLAVRGCFLGLEAAIEVQSTTIDYWIRKVLSRSCYYRRSLVDSIEKPEATSWAVMMPSWDLCTHLRFHDVLIYYCMHGVHSASLRPLATLLLSSLHYGRLDGERDRLQQW
jgi:hypothetical protein